MKSVTVSFRNLRPAVSLALGLFFGNAVWGAPSVQSIDVSPNPLITGQNFSIAVVASPDVSQATAVVSFRTAQPRSLQIPLTKQGEIWTGSGLAPTDVRQLPAQAGAMVRVLLFDAGGRRAETVVQVGVHVESITAVFAGGILTVTGDDQDNTIAVSRDSAGTILVNGGAVPVIGDVPSTNNTTFIQILGLNGNDALTVDDSNGPMPPANLVGGEGDDRLTGSAAADELDGGPGNDTLLGRDGNDRLLGGPGDDILIGGRGVDEHFGGDGDDQIVWNPGDGSDLVEGEGGNDTLIFIGANIAELMDASANGSRLRFTRNVGNIVMDCDGVEQVIVRALGGADTVTVNDLTGTQVSNVLVDLFNTSGAGDGVGDIVVVNGTATNDVVTLSGSTNGVNVVGLTAAVTVVGGEPDRDELVINALGGDDVVAASAVQAGAIELTLNGGVGTDMLIGGEGNDVLNGGPGADTAFGGAGNDTFVWNPGDANDLFEGQAGQDTMLFNGANISEEVDISANGQRLRFTRNVAGIVMDCNEVESILFTARGGADAITVHDLTGTGVTNVSLDLAGTPDTGVGDNAADTVIITGTSSNDVATVTGTPAGLTVLGLAATVNITGSEPALDQLIIQMLAGDDVVTATGLQDGVIKLTADGGPGDDVLTGSAGADVLLGGEGDDVLNGGPGTDVLDGGPGNNVLIQ